MFWREAALEWTDVPYRVVSPASWVGDSAIDELKRVNPLVQIPTLVTPAGGVLTESAAILIELGLAHPDSGLLGTDATVRARSIRGLVYVAANCYAAIGVIDYPERVLGADADEALRDRVRAATRARLHTLWDAFADAFVREGEPFLGGAQPDALDLLAAAVSRWSGTRPHLRQARPAFAALLGRIEQHPHVRPVFERHWPTTT